MGISVAYTVPLMGTPGRRRELDAAEKQAQGNLRRIWDEKREQLGLTQEGAAHRLGWKNQSAVNQYINGVIPLNTEATLKFAGLLQVHPREIDPRVRQLLPSSASHESDGQALDDRYVFVNKVKGPRIESGTGGISISWEHEEVDKSHAFQREFIQRNGWEVARLKIFKNHGQSNAPWIMDGDAVMVHLGDTAIVDSDDPTDNVFAIQYGEHSRFKRIVPLYDGAVILRSFNSDKSLYPDERVAGDELDSLQVLGRVVWRGG